MSIVIERAKEADVDELFGLYLSIYGRDYPLKIGTDRDYMLKSICNTENYYWYVARDDQTNKISGSCVIELDQKNKIGKVTGVAVSLESQGHGVAKALIKYCSDKALSEGLINSLYATSRTVNVSSQRMLLDNGFEALGIFPNARMIKHYETLTLLGKFSRTALEKRVQAKKIPRRVLPLVELVSNKIASPVTSEVVDDETEVTQENSKHVDYGFEFIYAPHFVSRRFDEVFKNDESSLFYPFHEANLLIASEVDDLEIYASFSKKDHYCVLVAADRDIRELGDRFKKLFFSLKEYGIYYVETMVQLDHTDALNFFLNNRFIPSAIYPGMRENNGKCYDYVLLTRTMVPLDFSDLSIDKSFHPFLKEYTKQWTKFYLDSAKVN